jgi:hypothetical protein
MKEEYAWRQEAQVLLREFHGIKVEQRIRWVETNLAPILPAFNEFTAMRAKLTGLNATVDHLVASGIPAHFAAIDTKIQNDIDGQSLKLGSLSDRHGEFLENLEKRIDGLETAITPPSGKP